MEQLISSGLSIKDSLEVVSVINEKSKGCSFLANLLLEQINKGHSFVEVIDQMDVIFPPLYRGIIKVGDKIGSIEKIFPKLKDYLEKQKQIKDKVSNALLYPILVLCTTIIVFTVMLLFVFPKLQDMFSEFGGSTASIIGNNISKIKFFLYIVLVIIAILCFTILFAFFMSKKNILIKEKLDRIKLKLPFVGKYITYNETLNFSFAMETLISSGITIENSLTESISVISNESFKHALNDINNQIVKGESLSHAFSKHSVFPSYINKWILVGEKTGKTEQIFSQIKNYFQNELNSFTVKFMSLIEPTLIILIGLLLIILIITVIIPIFSIYGDIV